MRKCQADEVLQGVKVTQGETTENGTAASRPSGPADECPSLSVSVVCHGRRAERSRSERSRKHEPPRVFRAEWLEAESPRQEARHLWYPRKCRDRAVWTEQSDTRASVPTSQRNAADTCQAALTERLGGQASAVSRKHLAERSGERALMSRGRLRAAQIRAGGIRLLRVWWLVWLWYLGPQGWFSWSVSFPSSTSSVLASFPAWFLVLVEGVSGYPLPLHPQCLRS